MKGDTEPTRVVSTGDCHPPCHPVIEIDRHRTLQINKHAESPTAMRPIGTVTKQRIFWGYFEGFVDPMLKNMRIAIVDR